MNRLKIFLPTLLCTVVLCILLPFRTEATGITWNFNETTGELRISGTGSMPGYEMKGAPWYSNAANISSIVIEEGITSIGKNAFMDCAATSISLPDTLDCIGSYAFSGCKNLTSVTIPANVTKFGHEAFSSCSDLNSVTFLNLGKSLYMGWYETLTRGSVVFSGCASPLTIRAYDVAGHSVWQASGTETWQQYASANGYQYASLGYAGGKLKNGSWVISTNYKLTISATGAVTENPWNYYRTPVSSLEICSGVTALPADAFYDYTSLTTVTMADTVTTLGSYAFGGCDKLNSVSLSRNLTEIPDGTFYECYVLTSVDIPAAVTAIGKKAFYDCRLLSSLSIPEHIISIGDAAFWNCGTLTSITLPDALQSLGAEAFSNCSSLTSLHIPASLTTIADNAFIVCPALKSFTVAAGNTAYTVSNGILYSKDGKTLICYPDGKDGTTFTVPQTVTAIAPYALHYNRQLTSLTLHSQIVSVGASAARYADSLANVYFDGTQEKWNGIVGSYAFSSSTAIHFSLSCSGAGTTLSGYKAATCTAAGYSGDTVCAGCGTLIKKGTNIAATGHSTVSHAAKSSTCTAVGWAAYVTCRNCDHTTYQEKPLLPHQMASIKKEPTCTEAGYKGYRCSSCSQYFTSISGAEVGERTPIPALGHTWGDWTVTAPPTWLEHGVESRSCSVCSSTETQPTPTTGQAAADAVTVTVNNGIAVAKNLPDGMTVILAAYKNGQIAQVAQGSLSIPSDADSLCAFFLADGWRPIAAPRPLSF